MSSGTKSVAAITICMSCMLSNMSMAAPVEQLKECQSIKDTKKRLACFDVASQVILAVAAVEQSQKSDRDVRFQEQDAKNRAEDEGRAQANRDDGAAKEALAGLKRLDTTVSTGISYRDYPKALSDAKFTVRTFRESPVSARRPLFLSQIEAAIADYENAKALWDMKFIGGGRPNRVVFTLFTDTHKMLNSYSRIGQARESNGDIVIDTALSVIWGRAQERIGDLDKLLLSEPKQ
jgi:hypothetical protein